MAVRLATYFAGLVFVGSIAAEARLVFCLGQGERNSVFEGIKRLGIKPGAPHLQRWDSRAFTKFIYR